MRSTLTKNSIFVYMPMLAATSHKSPLGYSRVRLRPIDSLPHCPNPKPTIFPRVQSFLRSTSGYIRGQSSPPYEFKPRLQSNLEESHISSPIIKSIMKLPQLILPATILLGRAIAEIACDFSLSTSPDQKTVTMVGMCPTPRHKGDKYTTHEMDMSNCVVATEDGLVARDK